MYLYHIRVTDLPMAKCMQPCAFFILQDRLVNHRSERLRRRAPADAAMQEDLRLKRRMVDLMEESEHRASEDMRRLTDRMDAFMTRGLDPLERLVDRQGPAPAACAPNLHAYHGPSYPYPYMHTAHPSTSHTPSHSHTPSGGGGVWAAGKIGPSANFSGGTRVSLATSRST